jgi:glycosyltransferase involved in cell wall biosynthesis
MRVSVVATVVNEAKSLPRLLDSLVAQTRLPDEVVICDGGSTDGTLALLETESRLPLRVIRRPGANIAVTDAGVRLSPQWLEKIVAPFEDAGTQAVSGFFRPDPQTVFELAMGATVLPEVQEFDLKRFFPSSRSFAFRKSAWEVVGGYPEWIDYCEDLIFDFRLRDRFEQFVFEPEALVHFRPRPNLRAFWHQYRQYARGDGKANLWPGQHVLRYIAYLSGPVLLAAGLLLRYWPLILLSPLPLVGVVALRSRRPCQRLVRLWGDLSPAQKLRAALWVPVIRAVGDVAKMTGYPAGVWWRWRHRGQVPNWREM